MFGCVPTNALVLMWDMEYRSASDLRVGEFVYNPWDVLTPSLVGAVLREQTGGVIELCRHGGLMGSADVVVLDRGRWMPLGALTCAREEYCPEVARVVLLSDSPIHVDGRILL
jgi:hypothetical protein